MAFRVNRGEEIGDGLARVARKTLAKAIQALDAAAPPEAIHAARKSTKKVRAIMVLAEQTVGHTRAVEKRLRRIAKTLSPLRDAHALPETLGRLANAPATSERFEVATAARMLTANAQRLDRAAVRDDLAAETRRALKRVKRKLRRVHLDRIQRSDVTASLERAYRRSRRAMLWADETGAAEDFHRWRKRVKTLWYQARLVAPHVRGVETLIKALGQIEEWLGDDHNVAVLREQLGKNRQLRGSGTWKSIERRCDAYQTELRQKALAVGRRIYADAPNRFIERLAAGRKPSRLQPAA